MKRTVQVNVKMTEEDFALLRKAAEEHWRDAVMTNSGIVLALARFESLRRDILTQKKGSRKKRRRSEKTIENGMCLVRRQSTESIFAFLP